MVQTESKSIPLGSKAPDFTLPDTDGNQLSLSSLPKKDGLLVAFICNHCPFVVHLREGLALVSRKLISRGIHVVAINSNDADAYPEDSPQKMAEVKEQIGFPFPYLFDETQNVARSYQAACTPDFFLFDGERKLFYHGQFDGSRPSNEIAVDGKDLLHAVDLLKEGAPPPQKQQPSIGCNIKWRN